jgi:ligand-binding sensor domain-containing protein
MFIKLFKTFYSFRVRKYCLFPALLVWCNLLQAQIRHLQFDKLNNNFSTNIVNAIYQDKKGWMWFSTSQGLNRYDGIQIKVFKTNTDDTSSIKGDLVRFIFEDSKGILWIGTEIGGLNRFNRETETFTWYPEYDESNKKTIYFANSVAEDKNGDLWIGSNVGLKKWNRTTGKFITYQNDPYVKNSLCENFIKKVFIDDNGKIWVGTNKGLDRYDPLANYFDHIPIFERNNEDRTICEIYQDNDRKIWVGTYAKGIFIINPDNFSFKQMLLPGKNEFSLTVRSIIQDKTGDYWIGTRDGLYIYNKATDSFSHFQRDEKSATSLCHNSVLSIFRDKKGDIWVGTRGGISYLINDKQVFRHYNTYTDDNR